MAPKRQIPAPLTNFPPTAPSVCPQSHGTTVQWHCSNKSPRHQRSVAKMLCQQLPRWPNSYLKHNFSNITEEKNPSTLPLHSHCFSQGDGNNFFLWGGPAISVFQMFPKALNSARDRMGGYIACCLHFYSIFNFWGKKWRISLALNLVTFIPIPKTVHLLFGNGNWNI